jgi:hypothetical protein
VGGAAEGGLGKVLAELGVPGLILLLWMAVAMARYLWSIGTVLRDDDPVLSKLAFGLLAFLVTNGFVYAIAHQVFGDPFILIILGFFLGFVMAMPKMVRRATPFVPMTAQSADTIVTGEPLAGELGGLAVRKADWSRSGS